MATVFVQERARIMGKFTVSLQCPAFLHAVLTNRFCNVPGATGCQGHRQLMDLACPYSEQKLWEDNQEELALIESLVMNAAGVLTSRSATAAKQRCGAPVCLRSAEAMCQPTNPVLTGLGQAHQASQGGGCALEHRPHVVRGSCAIYPFLAFNYSQSTHPIAAWATTVGAL
jgi:hypothetical protein